MSFTNVFSLPLSAAAWKAHLTRDRRDEVAFARRLHLYSAINVIRTRALLKATGRVTAALFLCNNYYTGADVGAAVAVRRFMLQDDPRWLTRLAVWVCHDRDVRRRRAEALAVFDRRRFKYELDVLLDNCVYPLNTLRHALAYVYAWEAPALSAFVYLWLLLLTWHNLLPYAVPISLIIHSAALAAYGALGVRHRSAIVRFCARPRTARGRTLLEKIRNFRDTLANNQVRMNRLNTYFLKLRSLYTWRDPDRTRLFVIALLTLGLLLTAIPFKFTFTAFLLLQLTKPLRPASAGLVTLMLRRFWDGLPVPTVADPVYAELPDDTPDLLRVLNPALAPQHADGDVMSAPHAAAMPQLGDGVTVQVLRYQ